MPEIPSLPNLQGNPLAVVDVETTGVIGGYHEIIQIAIVPMSIDMEIAEDVPAFYTNIRPDFPQHVSEGATRVHGIDMDELMLNAPTQERALDYLLEWFSKLPLGYRRRLTPIAHNWGFERSFLVPWLGPELFNSIFVPLPRDTMIFATMLNDRAALMGKELPFHRVGLGSMCGYFGIELHDAHDALADCVATAQLYSALMRAIS